MLATPTFQILLTPQTFQSCANTSNMSKLLLTAPTFTYENSGGRRQGICLKLNASSRKLWKTECVRKGRLGNRTRWQGTGGKYKALASSSSSSSASSSLSSPSSSSYTDTHRMYLSICICFARIAVRSQKLSGITLCYRGSITCMTAGCASLQFAGTVQVVRRLSGSPNLGNLSAGCAKLLTLQTFPRLANT